MGHQRRKKPKTMSSSSSLSPSSTSFVPGSTNKSIENDAYDDACDCGQFVINPCWYLFVKTRNCIDKCRRRRSSNSKIQSNDVTSTNDANDVDNFNDNLRTKYHVRIVLQQMIYLVLVYGCWMVVFARSIPRAQQSTELISTLHLNSWYILFLSCVTSYIKAKITSSGIITKDTIWKYDNYDYDNVLYVPNNICPTIGIRKLPRSKYDRYTQCHIPRFDHYCGWLDTPIGEDNYKYFLVFVFVHAIVFTYGFCIHGYLLWYDHNVLGQLDDDKEDYLQHFLIATSLDWYMTIITYLMLIASVCLLCFAGFHLSLVTQNITTNEYYRWKRIHQAEQLQLKLQQPQQQDEEKPSSSLSTTTTSSSSSSRQQQRQPQLPLAISTRNNSDKKKKYDFYNLGLMGNLYEVLYPRSQREHSKES